MTDSTLARYRNLVRNVANWPVYWREKFTKNFVPLEIHTRGQTLRFAITSRALYLVFKEIFVSDFYEISTLAAALPADATVVDVGANGGYFSMLLFSRLPRARVFAYEPVEANCRLFRSNVALNPALIGRVALEQAAVTGHAVASVDLHRESASDPCVTASVFADFTGENDDCVSVPAVSLAQIIKQNHLARVDLLKLDCEGSEYPIIYDSPEELWRSVRSLAIEAHPLDAKTRNAEALTRHLESLGYRCRSRLARNGCSALFATRAT